MQELLKTMILLSPVGLAIIACAGFGFALAARQALGMERGLRAAADRARDAALRTLSANKDWEIAEIGRFRRLLDAHAETIIAEATDFRERPIPSPGSILEGLVSWNADWKRQFADSAGLRVGDVEGLLKNELPITPPLARKLELFTGAPARFWERLWRLHDEYRTETDEAVIFLLDSAKRIDSPARSEHSAPELVDDGPRGTEPAPVLWSEASAGARPAPQPTSARSVSAAAPPTQRPASELRAPVVQPPEIAARGPRGGLPPPPKPRLRSPLADPDGGAQRRASTLTDFPIQRVSSVQADGGDWAQVERSPLNATLPGVGNPSPESAWGDDGDVLPDERR